MKIETKLNIGQKVYVIEEDKIVQGTISWMKIFVHTPGKELRTEVTCTIYLGDRFNKPWYVEKPPSEIFESKEELIGYIKGL